MRRLSALLLLLCGLQFLAVRGAEGACSSPVRGINLVPLPTGWVNGQVVNQFPGEEHIIYYKSVGFNAIRLPINWEAAQPALMGALDPAYLNDLKQFLAKADAQGVPVMVEVHNYDRYRGKLIGSPEVPGAAFQDLWRRLADALKDQKIVYGYGLMNEPHDTNGTWQTYAQYGVNGVRSVDSTRKIYVGGDGWSNSQLWPSNHPSPFVNDPAGKIVYEAHMYLDDDFSGIYKNPFNPSVDIVKRANDRLGPFVNWLKTYGQKGAIGETGVPGNDEAWIPGLMATVQVADAACMETYMWAGGRWSAGYILSLEPTAAGDKPQINALRPYFQSTAIRR